MSQLCGNERLLVSVCKVRPALGTVSLYHSKHHKLPGGRGAHARGTSLLAAIESKCDYGCTSLPQSSQLDYGLWIMRKET